ncbi:MAG: dihydroxy-acid dehydratase [Parvularculaceae bacterium]|nr:dihydroxy-acid dehydratase [Parvularculaceae bacterium]
MTPTSLRNAATAVVASGGSTNAVLHLAAIAAEAGVPFSIDLFDALSRETPVIADLKPGGKYLARDLYAAGGVRLFGRRLMEAHALEDAPGDRAPRAPNASRRLRQSTPDPRHARHGETVAPDAGSRAGRRHSHHP